MRVAFYAPMKPPDHPHASGDRAMARALMALLRAGGHEVELASAFRSYDRTGEAAIQRRLREEGWAEAEAFAAGVRAGRRAVPDLFFTYHSYHKAPDHLGPRVSAALGIPLVLAETSFSPRQASGGWAEGHADALEAIRRAHGLLAMTEVDKEGLERVSGRLAPVHLLRPFLPPEASARAMDRPAARGWFEARTGLRPQDACLVTVAMMRADVKERSYAYLARVLSRLRARFWHLLVAGDGQARQRVEAQFAAVREQVTFLGLAERETLAMLHGAADLFVWPAFREAYGVAILEAQAAGVPVLAGRHGGVPEIVQDGTTGRLVAIEEGDDGAAFAAALDSFIEEPSLMRAMGQAAARRVPELHGAGAALARLAGAMGSAQAVHRRITA